MKKKTPGTAAAWNQKVKNQQAGRGKGTRKSLPGQHLTIEGPGGTVANQPIRRYRFKSGSM